MLAYIVIAIAMFALGYVAALIKTNSAMSDVINSAKDQMDSRYKLGHRDGWNAALSDRSLVRSKYYEYKNQIGD